jgi:uncharacterized protein (DUF362 family)
MRGKRPTSRRDFLRNCIGGAVGLSFPAVSFPCEAASQPVLPMKSRVVVARDPLLHTPTLRRVASSGAAQSATADSQRMRGLLDHALQTLIPADDPVYPWSRIVRPGQLVGIKVNTLGGRGLSTNVQLVEAICDRLQRAGIRPQDIVVWDRDTDELERAGFRIRTGWNEAQCFGTDRAGFEDDLLEFGSVGSQLSKILTRRCDVLINVPVLKDHDGAGVSMALKNMYGVINNPNKYHPNGCDPFIADVNMLPAIRARLRLHICDATAACFDGGPAFKPETSWQPNALIASLDPVALDHIGWQMIERKREEKGLKSLAVEGRMPQYIATAADAVHRLGTNNPRQIELIETRVS